jgi:hypothetical protein
MSGKPESASAPEIARNFELGPEARALLVDGMKPEPFLDALQAGNHWADACRFLAHALPKRKAVMWAYVCLRQVLDADALETDAALRAAKCWATDPSEINRRAALGAAETATAGAPGGLVALAAGVSGGSLAPPGLPLVPPGERETARAVSGVVLLAAVRSQPEKAGEKFARFLELGREIWRQPLPTPPPPKVEAIQPPAQAGTSSSPQKFDDAGSIARAWSESEAAEHGQSVGPSAKPAPPAPPAKADRPILKPKSVPPISRPRREEPKPTFNDNESIGKISFEDEDE